MGAAYRRHLAHDGNRVRMLACPGRVVGKLHLKHVVHLEAERLLDAEGHFRRKRILARETVGDFAAPVLASEFEVPVLGRVFRVRQAFCFVGPLRLPVPPPRPVSAGPLRGVQDLGREAIPGAWVDRRRGDDRI